MKTYFIFCRRPQASRRWWLICLDCEAAGDTAPLWKAATAQRDSDLLYFIFPLEGQGSLN